MILAVGGHHKIKRIFMFGYYFSREYIWFLAAILILALLSAAASSRVRSAFKKYETVTTRSSLTGAEIAKKLLRSEGISDINVGKVSGELSDHYHPLNDTVNLSESTYNSKSVSAAAVSAHEVGHVIQHKNGFFLYNVRTALVPVVNIGSRLAFPLVLVGLLIDAFVRLSNPDTGFYIAMTGVILYASSLLFSLVTLPVELDASRRAIRMLTENRIISEDEAPAAKKVLSAAAMTYLVSTLASVVYFLRFLFLVLRLFGRRNTR